MFDEFRHRFWFQFGTPLTLNSMIFVGRFLNDLVDRFLIDFDPKWLPKVGDGTTLSRHFLDPVPQVVFLKAHLLALDPFWLPFGPHWFHFGRLGCPF